MPSGGRGVECLGEKLERRDHQLLERDKEKEGWVGVWERELEREGEQRATPKTEDTNVLRNGPRNGGGNHPATFKRGAVVAGNEACGIMQVPQYLYPLGVDFVITTQQTYNKPADGGAGNLFKPTWTQLLLCELQSTNPTSSTRERKSHVAAVYTVGEFRVEMHVVYV